MVLGLRETFIATHCGVKDTNTHGLFVGLKATLNYMVRGVVGKEGRKKKVSFLPKKFYVNVSDILELFLFLRGVEG